MAAAFVAFVLVAFAMGPPRAASYLLGAPLVNVMVLFGSAVLIRMAMSAYRRAQYGPRASVWAEVSTHKSG